MWRRRLLQCCRAQTGVLRKAGAKVCPPGPSLVAPAVNRPSGPHRQTSNLIYRTIVLELSKEKANASLLDRQLNQFQTSINRVESELSAQIRYLTQVATGQPHEGSTYSARKDCQMALNRSEYARVKLGELGRTCEIMLEPQT
uniref:Mediator of RNA polymerase II transcription subunit 11 n=1 Tax=Cyprinus carpio carpio TaxID=630221 RepID=A0A8C1B2T1_CYPCA